MALIINCRECRRRVPESSQTCPFCGSSDYKFIIDHWPRGRNGRRIRMPLPDEIKTAPMAREIERSVHSARTSKRSVADISLAASTVADLFPDYLGWYRLHKAPTTWHDVSGTWERDIKRILGEYVVISLSADHFSLYQKMRGGKVSNRTVNKELDYFRGFLRWCRKEKKLDIPRIDYDELPFNRPLPIVLSPDEIVRIIAAAEEEPLYHALFLCLYTLGLRISEVRGIRLEDFDFSNHQVRVLQKGGAWKILPVSEQVATAVKKVIDARKPQLKAEQYIFSARKSGKPLQNIRKAIERICKKAEVTKKVNPHLFRHSCATHMMGANVNLRTIQRYLGHMQSSTTEFYTQVAMGDLRNAQNVVDVYKKS